MSSARKYSTCSSVQRFLNQQKGGSRSKGAVCQPHSVFQGVTDPVTSRSACNHVPVSSALRVVRYGWNPALSVGIGPTAPSQSRECRDRDEIPPLTVRIAGHFSLM